MNKTQQQFVQEINNAIIENIEDIFNDIGNEESIKILDDIPDYYKDDKEVMLAIMEANNNINPLLGYCSERLRSDPLFVYEAVKISDHNFEQADIELQNSKEFVLKCLGLSKFLIEDAPEQFLDDKDCAIAAIKRKGLHAFVVISDRLKNDKEVAIAAIDYQPICYDVISATLKNNKEIILFAMGKDPGLIQLIPKIYKDDKEVVLKCLSFKYVNNEDETNLQFVSERLQEDQEVVLTAIKNRGNNLQFAGKEFKKNKEMIVLAIKNGGSLEHVGKKLRDDPEIVLLALKNSGSQLKYAGNAFKKDKDIVLMACQDNIENIQYASLEIQEEIGHSNPVQFIIAQKRYNEINDKVDKILVNEEVKKIKKKI